MMKNLVYSLLILLTFVACHDDDAPQIKMSDTTVIVYMVADNNLNPYAKDNINKMEKGLPNNKQNLIVYFDPLNDMPKLLRIQKDNSKDIKSEVIAEYKEQNSADPIVMNKVLNDIKKRYPSKSYGLILWSHGDAWIPPKQVQTRAIFEDNGIEMDIKDFAQALPNGFDYCIFDACWMGSVEFLYELRNKTPFVLASAIEVMGDGMPYDEIVPFFFEDIKTEKKLMKIGSAFFNYYNNYYNKKYTEQQNRQAKTAQTSLIKMSELEELANRTRTLLKQNPLPLWDYNINKVQKLYTFIKERPLYDFMDFLAKNYTTNEIDPIQTQLNKVVLFERYTERYLDEIPLQNVCGLSCYIPQQNGRFSKYNSYYQTLSWTKASGFHTLFKE